MKDLLYLEGNEMRICDVIEELSLDQITPDDPQTKQLIDCFNDSQWNELVLIFLKGIGNNHLVPGKVVHQLMGISDWFRELKLLTIEQKWFILHRCLANWNQMSCESRAQLNL
jgi:hypothetical protein